MTAQPLEREAPTELVTTNGDHRQACLGVLDVVEDILGGPVHLFDDHGRGDVDHMGADRFPLHRLGSAVHDLGCMGEVVGP